MSIAMPAGVAESAFEVVAFHAQPVDGGVAVLELRGRFTGPAPRHPDRPRLRVERPRETAELTALRDAGDITEAWSATFAVAVDALQDATFALAVGRSLLLDLPAPDVQTPDGSPAPDYVRLAREANHNRRQLLDLQIALDAEQEARALVQRHADELTIERDAAQQERDAAQEELRAGLDELDAERVRMAQSAADEVAQAHAGHEQALVDAQAAHDEALAALQATHGQEIEGERDQVATAQANADDARAHADATRDELTQLRAELGDARAELEAAHFASSADRSPGDLGAHVEHHPDPLATTAVVPLQSSEEADAQVAADAEVEVDPEGEADAEEELRTLEAPPRMFAMSQGALAAPRELLTVATAHENRSRTIALSVLAVAFFAFAAALGIGPL